ncbi:MAG: serine hydrolase domain-containing protein [Burkholderiaceae bacterium]
MTQPSSNALPVSLPAPHELDADASCPMRMGWMQGTPPAADRLIRFDSGDARRFPQSRWAFSHTREFQPTLNIPRGDGSVASLPIALRSDLDDIALIPMGASGSISFAQSLKANYTDGIVVLHRGRIVLERYFGALSEHRPHIAFSVTKSFVGTLGALLVAEGVLDESRPVVHWVPELAGSGFGNASLGEVMDMTTALDFSEVYTDPNSGIAAYARAGGLAPRAEGTGPAEGLYAFLQTVGGAGEHGKAFTYRSINTDVLAWVIQRATGERFETLLSTRLWSQLGVERDAHITCDAFGMPFAAGGLCTTLRDLARMGEMIRCEGAFNGRQLVPASAVAAIRGGGKPEKFTPAGYALLPGWSYRHQWWNSHNAHGMFMARGIHGQAIVVNPAAEMVIARYASHPLAANANLDPTSLPAWEALAGHLIRNPA